MSTKTSIKRIAAVAAVALTLGGFSAVSANAAGTPTHSAATLLAGSTVATGSGTAAGTQVTGGIATVVLTETTTVASSGSAAVVGTLASSGVGSFVSSSGGTQISVAPLGALTGSVTYPTSSVGIVASTTAANGESITFTVTSAVAGTQTLTFTPLTATGAPGTAITATITWGAAPTVNAGYTATASFIDDGATRPSAANASAVLAYSKAVPSGSLTTSNSATIAVNVKDGSNLDLNGVALTASISGPGLLTLASGTSNPSAFGTVRSQSLTATNQASTNHATIVVSADGTAGVSTITVSSGTTVLFTKTVTFYGTVATLTATQNLFVAKAGATGATLGSSTSSADGLTVANTAAVEIVAKDANGVVVPGLTITGKSSDTAIIASASVSEEAGTAATIGANGAGYYIASVTSAGATTSGQTATVTFRTLLADGVTYVSAAPVTFTLGGTVAGGSVSAAFAETSYAAGTKVSLVFTAKDSAGNAPYDGQAVLSATSSSNVGISSGSLPGTSLQTVNGKATATFYAPIIGGTLTVSGYDATTAGATAAAAAGTKNVSVSVAVEGAGDAAAQAAIDAAQEATDAANAAYDAANNAMDSADAATAAAQDAADNASAALAAVTSLSATVAKLVKSVAAIAAALAKVQKKIGA